jgi:hypothetical protein
MQVPVNTTIVSAFLTNINENRSVEKYVAYGTKLIELNVPKVIFIEKLVYQTYFSHYGLKTDTKFIFMEKTDLFLYPYKEEFVHFHVQSTSPRKDTLEYMFVQNHKLEWIRQASEQNYFQTSQFVWVDFGIFHLFSSEENFTKGISNVVEKEYESVRIAGIWRLSDEVQDFDFVEAKKEYLFHQIGWFFAGSVIGGNKSAVIEFADLCKQKCLFLLKEYQHIMWEVNVWALVYLDLQKKKDKDTALILQWYPSDHNDSILMNY